MTTVPAPSWSTLSIKHRLEVLLLCFEAAADCFPPFALAYAKEQRHPRTGRRLFRLWDTADIKRAPPYNLPSTFPPSTLPAALSRWNMCDYFVWLLEAEANKQLERYGAFVRWMEMLPTPSFYLASRDNEMRMHSVLLVTESDGSRKAMDATPQQYGWERKTWLLNFDQFVAERMYCSFAARSPGEEERRDADEEIRQRFDGFWNLVKYSMEELFEELRWDVLVVLPRRRRVRMVKKQAWRKFAVLRGLKFADLGH